MEGFLVVLAFLGLFVLGFPVVLTNAYVAVDAVEPDAVEAARGMGMRPLQILVKVDPDDPQSLLVWGAVS